MRVLIVDDEPIVRGVVRAILEHDVVGAEVAGEAGSGPEALGLCSWMHPDVIVLDQRMPGMSGLEVAAQVLDAYPTTAIVLFTAHLDDKAIQARAAELGSIEVLPKARVLELPDAVARSCVAVGRV